MKAFLLRRIHIFSIFNNYTVFSFDQNSRCFISLREQLLTVEVMKHFYYRNAFRLFSVIQREFGKFECVIIAGFDIIFGKFG